MDPLLQTALHGVIILVVLIALGVVGAKYLL